MKAKLAAFSAECGDCECNGDFNSYTLSLTPRHEAVTTQIVEPCACCRITEVNWLRTKTRCSHCFRRGESCQPEAKNHLGEKATVCGDVASTHYAERTKGAPTFLNVDKPYPNQVFTILIWGTDRPKFGTPDRAYAGKHICATGTIKDFRGVPEIVVYEPSQISLR
jgi:hypothetical protein